MAIDNDGDYEPGNVRWDTSSQQGRNQRHRPPDEALVCRHCGRKFRGNSQFLRAPALPAPGHAAAQALIFRRRPAIDPIAARLDLLGHQVSLDVAQIHERLDGVLARLDVIEARLDGDPTPADDPALDRPEVRG